MFFGKLENFIVKRISMLALVAAVIAMFFGCRWNLFIGIASGAVFSICRFCCNSWIFKNAIGENRNIIKTLILYLLNQLILIAVIYWFYLLNKLIFVSFIAGVLLAPIAIIVNSLTEVLGITKNKFFIA